MDMPFLMPKNEEYQTWINRKDGVEEFFYPEYMKEIKWMNDFLDACQVVFKSIYILGGNHDQARIDKFKSETLPGYQHLFDWKRDLFLSTRNIDSCNYNDWLDLGDELTITHGMAHGSTCLKKHYELSGGKSVIFGHVHTADVKSFAARGKCKKVWSLPCMSTLAPGYIKNAEVPWSNGFMIVNLRPNSMFNAHVMEVWDDKLVLPSGKVVDGSL